MHLQHVLPLLLKDLVLAIQLLNVLGLLDNVLSLSNGFCKSENAKYTVSTRRIHKFKSDYKKERKNRRLLLMICSFKKAVLPFSASKSARIFWYLSLAMPLRAFSFCGKKRVQTLFGLLGASSRKIST